MPEIKTPEFVAATLPPAQQWEGKMIWREDTKVFQYSNGQAWSDVGAVSGDGFLIKATMGIVGQSNEAGSTLYQDAAGVWQRYSAAAPAQGIYEPVSLQKSGCGSMFTAVAQLLAADKIKVDLHNGAVGGTSLYVDWTGFSYTSGRANNTPYRGRRAAGTAQNVTLNITTNSTTTATTPDTAYLVVGMALTGNANIPNGTTVISITNSTTFVLSASATGTASSVATVCTSPNTVAGDLGHRGDLIYVAGATPSTWEATTGNRHFVFSSDAGNPVTMLVDGTTKTTFFGDAGVIAKEVRLVTAATPPSFPASPVVGDTRVDGAITWTCINVGAKTIDAGSVHVNRFTEDGFDPYFLCKRVLDALMGSAVSSTKRYVYIQNGQADAGVATAIYSMALRMLGQYFGRLPYLIQPIFGLSIYAPGQGQANWDLLETALSNSGLNNAPNYAASPVSVGLGVAGEASGFHLAVPGQPITNFGYYYGQSLYRTLGTAVESLLQPDQRHTTVDGMKLCAQVLAPTISRIMRNSAT